MFPFFDQLLQFVEVIVGNAINIATGLIRALALLGTMMQIPTFVAGFLPGLLGVSVLLTTAILIVRFFLLK